MKIITNVVDVKLEKDELKKIEEVSILLQSMSEELSKVNSRNTYLEIRDLDNCVNLLQCIIKQYDTTTEESDDLIEIEKETHKSLLALLSEPISQDMNDEKETEEMS